MTEIPKRQPRDAWGIRPATPAEIEAVIKMKICENCAWYKKMMSSNYTGWCYERGERTDGDDSCTEFIPKPEMIN